MFMDLIYYGILLGMFFIFTRRIISCYRALTYANSLILLVTCVLTSQEKHATILCIAKSYGELCLKYLNTKQDKSSNKVEKNPNLGPIHMGTQVPSPTYISKSRISNPKNPLKHTEFFTILCQTIYMLWIQLFARPNSRPKSRASLLENIVMQASMSYLGLRTLCEVVSPNFHALKSYDCTT